MLAHAWRCSWRTSTWGRLLLKPTWSKAFSDLNPATGNFLLFGLALLVFDPALVALLKGQQAL